MSPSEPGETLKANDRLAEVVEDAEEQNEVELSKATKVVGHEIGHHVLDRASECRSRHIEAAPCLSVPPVQGNHSLCACLLGSEREPTVPRSDVEDTHPRQLADL